MHSISKAPLDRFFHSSGRTQHHKQGSQGAHGPLDLIGGAGGLEQPPEQDQHRPLEQPPTLVEELGLLAEKFQLGQGAGGLPLAEGLGGGPNGGLNGLLPGLWCGKGVKGGTFHQGASFLRNCARSSLALRIRYLTKGRPMPRILAISRCLRSWRKKSTAAG